ncbi:6-carboxytetrahydropterin synthase [Halioglobus pacificus]|uniref:6-carboxy-5,6,7,8-tetrahydropterin synthase n=1 Tax=Parahalioglobus pacificus TaxID=930806 RepID=A0A918XDT7_9GAMM|nr:6-carboxytetrahydropterin synthase [Halioglobus pacificus]NQY02018.1 6-carboxytetrahydropterin synthase [Halieaceae bacterium]GHD27570.1 hypothetical protein GCM10007053_06070 [Halioglobus pacificus]
MARLFVENLTVMDFSYLDAARGVVGESWIVDIELSGELDDQGMVFDFGSVKKQIKQFIDAQADHRLLVPVESAGCEIEKDGQEVRIRFPLSDGGEVRHRSPKDAVLLLDSDTLELPQIGAQLEIQLKEILPDNVKEVAIVLRSESIAGAFYHYTHGLQKHQGQCQRIAHGHRSRLEVSIDGSRDSDLETQWSQRLADAYVATDVHVVEEFEHNGIPHTSMQYTAAQGEFAISLPSKYVFTMPHVSTVENIAMHLASCIAEESRGKVCVKAFEGVGKGALGFA